MEESIYNLIPPPKVVPPVPPRYHSKYPGTVTKHDVPCSELGVDTVRPRATFGPPNSFDSTSASKFLFKHSKEPVLPEPKPPTTRKMKIKSAVPPRTEKPVMGLVTNKNFITSNAIETIMAKPKKENEAFSFLEKKDFGKIPAYLKKNKARIEEERTLVQSHLQQLRERDEDQHVEMVSREERNNLLRHLKLKWATVNQAYQKLPFSLDTPAKQKRKEKFEKELTEIEKDIHLLERGETILVLQD